MGETPEHKHIKELLRSRFKEWFGAAAKEYMDSGTKLDILAVTPDGVKIAAEIIWSTGFQRDMNLILQSDAQVKVVVVSHSIFSNEGLRRRYEKYLMSERLKGYLLTEMIDADRILKDKQYLEYDFKDIVSNLLSQVRARGSKEDILTHMMNLKSKAIDPWVVFLLEGQRLPISSGALLVEQTPIGYLYTDHYIHVSKQFKEDRYRFTIGQSTAEVGDYIDELKDHLSTGYPRKLEEWNELKKCFSAYIVDVKNLLMNIENESSKIIQDITGLSPWHQFERDEKEFFNPIYIAYIVYVKIEGLIKGFYVSDCRTEEDQSRHDWSVLEWAQLTNIAKGDTEKVRKIHLILCDFSLNKDFHAKIKNLTQTRENLNNGLVQFVSFLKRLSKLIENNKRINGHCDMCPTY